jgi:hypothetical protein
MLRTPVAEPASDVVEPLESLVPLSVLSLDLEAPPGGWDAFLGSRGIAIGSDDLGRKAISRGSS